MVVVIGSIVLDLTHEAWVEWRRFLCSDLTMRAWEKRFVLTEKAALILGRGRSRR